MTPRHTPLSAEAAVAHLTPERWEHANRLLVRKTLAEFAHERLLEPRPTADGHYRIRSDEGDIEYSFAATVLSLEHWHVDASSIARRRVRTPEAGGSADGSAQAGGVAASDSLPLDALELITELRETLGLSPQVLPVYLEEISSTLSGTAFKLAQEQLDAPELARADFQRVEAGMTEGHPCFVANNGRLGFDLAEYHAYAPEAGAPVRLAWLAADRRYATFTASAGLMEEELLREELDPQTRERFDDRLRELGLRPADYQLIPVHPWQWWNKLSVTFAAEVARRRLVFLGHGDDEHQAQQSIRTFFNTSRPSRHYVKTALSVLNMGFLRGLSAAYMKATPAINDWLHELVAQDPVLRASGLAILRERAAVGYHPEVYEAACEKSSPYLKMLAALWRESPVPLLGAGERLVTMASLLHTDRHGGSFAVALIRESGLEPADWLRRYLDTYLTPLLHCFYAYELVFMPHGENVILVLDQHGVPQRALFKDIAEEIAVMSPETPLPPEVERIRAEVPADMKVLSLFTDVFDCFFRFLNGLLAVDGILDEDTFWTTVADCVTDYQKSAPHLAERFERYDLFCPDFALSALNRLQLRDNQQMVDLQDPAGALQLVGTLANPIAPYA
ncbi:IucA/IucC family protein [Streptomyces oceani]|uniref:IucA/IucC family protein n=1 Tax=Streptomyces oceani TaxID=1075402 RepID=A0A1E7KGN1_9ACTN|nr:IucA/IucC family siderophore biosynthesis protein [Streptomyces oceani]OEV03081.1 IucA/IucC family protein [Streptomyces oceani]